MKDAGIVAVSDDGMPVMNADLMRRALEYARTFDLPVVQHAEDLHLAQGGVMNEGPAATRAGLRGQPPAAESVMVARDLELVALDRRALSRRAHLDGGVGARGARGQAARAAGDLRGDAAPPHAHRRGLLRLRHVDQGARRRCAREADIAGAARRPRPTAPSTASPPITRRTPRRRRSSSSIRRRSA